MTAGPTIKRRQFMLGAIGLGFSTVLWRQAGWWGVDGARLAGLLEHRESAWVVGQQYLRLVPDEARTRVLTTRLVDGLPIGHRVFGLTDDQLRASLLRLSQQDFREGRVVELDGWMTSVTEARLCAVTALHLSDPS